MLKVTWWVLALTILSLSAAQEVAVAATATEFDPELLTILNNYFGCKTWEEGVCVECSEHYYFNKNGICCEVKPECRIFNVEEGICIACYQGWKIIDGKCEVIDLANSDDAGCKQWVNGVCS